MIEVRQTEVFAEWFAGLQDRNAKGRILVRIRRIEDGNLGDVKPVSEGVHELRITYGPGYRLYFTQRGETVVVVLCGGDKASQHRDVKQAKKLAAGL